MQSSLSLDSATLNNICYHLSVPDPVQGFRDTVMRGADKSTSSDNLGYQCCRRVMVGPEGGLPQLSSARDGGGVGRSSRHGHSVCGPLGVAECCLCLRSQKFRLVGEGDTRGCPDLLP